MDLSGALKVVRLDCQGDAADAVLGKTFFYTNEPQERGIIVAGQLKPSQVTDSAPWHSQWGGAFPI